MATEAVVVNDVKESKIKLPIDSHYPQVAEYLMGCKSKQTATAYRGYLTRFFKWCDIEPPVLLDMSLKEVKSIVVQYAMYLKREAKPVPKNDGGASGNFSVNSVKFMLNSVRVFLDYHDLSISWTKLKRYVPEGARVVYHIYTRDEIKRMLKFADQREKAMILLLESSGIRAEGVVQLQLRDFQIIEDNIGHLVVYARSKEDFYHTFCTPECTEAIQEYLKWRESEGETLSPTSPLIRDHIRQGRHRKQTNNRMWRGKADEPRPIRRLTLWKTIRNMLEANHIKHEHLQPDHSFRKFMNTAVANAKANPLFKEIMMGHSVKLDNVYYNKDDPESLKALLEEYRKAINSLTINDEYRLREENTKLADRLKDMPKLEVMQTMLIQKDVEFENYKKKMEEDRQRDKDELKEEMRKEMAKLVVDRYVEGNGYRPAGDKASPTPPAAAAE